MCPSRNVSDAHANVLRAILVSLTSRAARRALLGVAWCASWSPLVACSSSEPEPDPPPVNASDASVEEDGGSSPACDAGEESRPAHPGLESARPRNVIFLLADGYGAAQIEATRMFLNGNTAPLSYEKLPHQALVTTNTALGTVTDSGAGATALATGHKVGEYTVGVALPGDGRPLRTALEYQAAQGKLTGLVTTHTQVTDATPAAFAAHQGSRFNDVGVAMDYFSGARPNLLMGLEAVGVPASMAQAAGYTVVQSQASLRAIDVEDAPHIFGYFTEATVPPLETLALEALRLLEDGPNGFFLLVEQEQTDTGGHANNLPLVLQAAAEFERAVQAVVAWAEDREDTLVIVGADHETGGLTVTETNPTAGVVPAHTYTTSSHTGAPVRFFASGPDADLLDGTLDNTEIFPLLAGSLGLRCGAPRRQRGADCGEVLAVQLSELGEGGALSAADHADASASEDTLVAVNQVGHQQQALLAFPDIGRQGISSCNLQAAKLVLHAQDGSLTGVSLHRMLRRWNEDSSWNSISGGVQADGVEAQAVSEMTFVSAPAGVHTFDVTETVRGWLDDPRSNRGWVVLSGGGDAVQYGAPDTDVAPELRLYLQ